MEKYPQAKIVYEDKYLVLVYKPATWVIDKPEHFEGPAVQNWLHQKIGAKPGSWGPFPVHQLDKCVSGLLLFARKKNILIALQQQFLSKQIQKIYLLQTKNALPEQSGRLSHYHSRDPQGKKALIFDEKGPDRKEVHLQYTFLHKKNGLYTYEIRLETGRYHQIRAQMAHMNCPILDDSLYNGKNKVPEKIALSAHKLIFTHPVSTEVLSFSLES